MARPGVTYHEVLEIANQMKAEGKNPTIEQIRLALGTGSSTTIARHLSTWRRNQDQTDVLATKAQLPSEFVDVMKGLWQRVLTSAEEKITAIEEEGEAAAQTLRETNAELQKQNQAWDTRYQQLCGAKESLEHDHLGLQQALIQTKEELSIKNAALEGSKEQIDLKEKHLEELRHLQQQTQENLEHYREAAREQRLLDQERYNEQLRILETSNNLLQQEYKEAQKQNLNLAQQLNELTHQYQILNATQEKSTQQISAMTQQIDQLQQDKTAATQRATFAEKEQNRLQELLEKQHHFSIELQKELAVAKQQLTQTTQNLEHLQKDQQQLAHDKWTLAQEKALAEGQVKQLQQILAQYESSKKKNPSLTGA